jgi:hypothetical protein
MKKLISLLITIVFTMATAFPVVAVGETSPANPVSGDYEYKVSYEISSDGTATVTEYLGTDTDIEIPAELDGYAVTKIGNYAFYNCDLLKSVVIPEGVTYIGYDAFAYSEIESVVIPEGVTDIDYSAFESCTSLKSITIPDSVTYLAGWSFGYCYSLTEITIGKGVTDFYFSDWGDWGERVAGAFEGCTSIAQINVSEENPSYASVDGALYNKDLTELIKCPPERAGEFVIPDSVIYVDFSAFNYCNLLTSITFSENARYTYGIYYDESYSPYSYYDNMFDDCSSLTEINVSEDNQSLCSVDGVLFNKSLTGLISCPRDKTGDYVIPDGVMAIYNSAFKYCSLLTSVTIPDSVYSIGDTAFLDCSSLTSITIPDSVTEFGFNVFYDCSSLTEINVSEDNQSLCSIDGVLLDKELTTLISCPQSKTGEFTIPDGVTRIEHSAFKGCTLLESVTIPTSVTESGFYEAFDDCYNLTIYGYAGSYAEECADDYNIPFVSLDEEITEPITELTTESTTEPTIEPTTNPTTSTTPGENSIQGDLDGDNAVGITDLVITAKIIQNQIPYIKSLFTAADLNEDNVINAVDLAIMKYLIIK